MTTDKIERKALYWYSGRNASTGSTNTAQREIRRSKRKKVYNANSGTDTSTSSTNTAQTVKRVLRRSEQTCVKLLPGIPNDIVMDAICTKLSWGQLQMLASVSRSWKQALESPQTRRQIYETRVSTHSTETLAVVYYVKLGRNGEMVHAFALYSIRDKSWYGHLPPIPFLEQEAPREAFQCIALDGKIYILGGWEWDREKSTDGWTTYKESAEVYVLDLVGQRKWTQCASMQEPRHAFAVGVLHGKIYVFGGHSVLGCESYDPKINAWSKIGSLPESRFYHRVATVGEELWIYGGYNSNVDLHAVHRAQENRGDSKLLAYHPVKDEWRSISEYDKEPSWSAEAFIIEGKLQRFTSGGIDIYDVAENSWSPLHSFSGAFPVRPEYFDDLRECDSPTIVIGDELLKLDSVRKCLLLTRGFGSQSRNILLESTNCFMQSGKGRRLLPRLLKTFPIQL